MGGLLGFKDMASARKAMAQRVRRPAFRLLPLTSFHHAPPRHMARMHPTALSTNINAPPAHPLTTRYATRATFPCCAACTSARTRAAAGLAQEAALPPDCDTD